jgi:hypothetical protein
MNEYKGFLFDVARRYNRGNRLCKLLDCQPRASRAGGDEHSGGYRERLRRKRSGVFLDTHFIPSYESKEASLPRKKEPFPILCTWREEAASIVTKTKKKGGIKL